jgi:general secretion pathway protein M
MASNPSDTSIADTEPNAAAVIGSAVAGTPTKPRRSARGGGATTATSALSARWLALSERDRTLLAIAGAVLGLFLLYALAIRPAWATVRSTPNRIADMDVQIQQMQRQVVESKELRGTPRTQPQQSAAALKSATDALGATGKLAVAGDRATLTVQNATGDQIRRWLADARSNARVRALEATLTRGPSGYTGSLVVALPTP